VWCGLIVIIELHAPIVLLHVHMRCRSATSSGLGQSRRRAHGAWPQYPESRQSAPDAMCQYENQTAKIPLPKSVPRTQGCSNKINGGTILATAKDVKEPQSVKLVFRVKYKTKGGDRQVANSYYVELFRRFVCTSRVGIVPTASLW
jgi:hypothetical protein